MLENIIKQLNISDATCWKIQESIVKSQEYFFIKDKTDVGRVKKIRDYEVTIYKDFTEDDINFRGSSSVNISPMLSLVEIQEAIEGAVFAAGFVKNPWYPITEAYSKEYESKKYNLESLSKKSVAAIFNAQTDVNSWLNSVELFITERKIRIINSKGLDVSHSKLNTYIETIVSASGKEEVELYDEFKLSYPKDDFISTRISKLLKMVGERANAIATPSLKEIPIILTGEPVKEFMRYYLQQANAQMKYDKISEVEPGSFIQGEESGDKISLDILPELEGSYYGAPFDEDGFEVKQERIVEDGVLKNYWGDLRYSHYLGVPPTGSAENFKIDAGKLTSEQLREKPYLEVSHFSAIDTDMATGDFGGEIRLGWYYDGSKRVPVSGGSVTGNIRNLSSIKLSKEVHVEGDYSGPSSILLEGFRVSGE